MNQEEYLSKHTFQNYVTRQHYLSEYGTPPDAFGFKKATIKQAVTQTQLFEVNVKQNTIDVHKYLKRAHKMIVEHLLNNGITNSLCETEDLEFNPNASAGAFSPFQNKKAYVESSYGLEDMETWWSFAHIYDYQPIWSVAPKEEILPFGKDGRTFEIPPVNYLFYSQRLAQNFHHKIYEDESTPIMVGIDLTKGGMNNLCSRLRFKAKGSKFGMGDLRKYDKHQLPEIREYARLTRLATYVGDSKDEFEIKLNYSYKVEYNSFFVLPGGQVVFKEAGGMNSGSFYTSIDGSIVTWHMALAYILYAVEKEYGRTVYDYHDSCNYMRWAIYSDDHLFSVNAAFSRLASFELRDEFFRNCGVELKKEDDVVVTDTYKGLTFLGGILTQDKTGSWVLYYRPERVKAALYYKNKRELNPKELMEKLKALLFLSYYSPNYKSIRNVCHATWNEIAQYDSTLPDLPTDDELRTHWLGLECRTESRSNTRMKKELNSMQNATTQPKSAKAEKRKLKRKLVKEQAKLFRQQQRPANPQAKQSSASNRKAKRPAKAERRKMLESEIVKYAESGGEVDFVSSVPRLTKAERLFLTLMLPNVFKGERWGALTAAKTAVMSTYTRMDYPWVGTQTPPVDPPINNTEAFLFLTKIPEATAIVYDPVVAPFVYNWMYNTPTGPAATTTMVNDPNTDRLLDGFYLHNGIAINASGAQPHGQYMFSGTCKEQPEGRFLWIDAGMDINFLMQSGEVVGDGGMFFCIDLWTPEGMYYNVQESTHIPTDGVAGSAEITDVVESGYYAIRVAATVALETIILGSPPALTSTSARPIFCHIPSAFYADNYQTMGDIRMLNTSVLYTNTAAKGYRQGNKYQLTVPKNTHWTTYVDGNSVTTLIENDANIRTGTLETGAYSVNDIGDPSELEFQHYHSINGNGIFLDSYWPIDQMGTCLLNVFSADLPTTGAVTSPQKALLVINCAAEVKTSNQSFPSAMPDASFFDSVRALELFAKTEHKFDNENHLLGILGQLGGGIKRAVTSIARNWPTIASTGGAIAKLLL